MPSSWLNDKSGLFAMDYLLKRENKSTVTFYHYVQKQKPPEESTNPAEPSYWILPETPPHDFLQKVWG
jgi:hypothetical protein